MLRYSPVALFAAVSLFCAASPKLTAAVVILANASSEPIRFTLTHASGQPATHSLAADEVRSFPCGRQLTIAYGASEKPTERKLDAYAAYKFIAENGITDLRGIELAGKPVPLTDVPIELEPAAKPLKVPVTLLVDDAERRTQRVWEETLRKRLALAAEVLAAHGPVQFEVAGVAEWTSQPDSLDLSALYGEFQKAAKPAAGGLAIGYTSRFATRKLEDSASIPYAHSKTALVPHILIREWEPRTEPERVEVLIQQLGKYLGAVYSPDPRSAMRPKLGDGKAAYTRFRLGFDPLNTLAINIWTEELRSGKVKKIADLSPAAQARLGRIYATLAHAIPEEPIPEEYAGLVENAKVGLPDPLPVEPPTVIPAAVIPEKLPRKVSGLNAKQEATRAVIQAIVVRAVQNNKLAVDDGRLRGDELTAAYVMAAAHAARTAELEVRSAAFAIGIGIALDDSQVLRGNPLTAQFCKAVESEDERKQRLAMLGLPTVRKRRDLCQHFAVSAALAELIGPKLAEQAGLAKELLDLKRDSGFSFTDLCADHAGIEFAALAKAKPDLIEQWSRAFAVADFVPKMDGLRDGLTEERFKEYYGSVGDDRFKEAMDEVRKRVQALSAYVRTER